MNKKIRYALSTFNRPDILRQCIQAAYDSTLVPNEVIVIDNSPEQYATGVLLDMLTKYKNLYVLPQSTNIGLSGSWNWYMENYNDYLLFPNDDVIVHPHTIEAMYKAAETNPKEVLFFGLKDAFSFYLLKKIGWETVGGFDPAFHPIYFDDNDMAYKLKLAGWNPIIVPEATFEHLHGGSSSLKAYSQKEMEDHHQRFQRNQNYYIRKWGGIPGQETYVTAFNKG